MTTTVKTAMMEAKTKLPFVKSSPGEHCSKKLPYLFICPNCNTRFCSQCYKLSPAHAGAVICRGCEEVLYFATGSKKSNAESSKPGGIAVGN